MANSPDDGFDLTVMRRPTSSTNTKADDSGLRADMEDGGFEEEFKVFDKNL